MDELALRLLLDQVRLGELDADEAVRRLRRLPYVDLGYARVDHHRTLRQRFPESVYAPGKTPEQCAGIVVELLSEGDGPVVLSRADEVQIAAAQHAAAEDRGVVGSVSGGTVVWRPAAPRVERVVVVTAGTADLPVAHEARATLAAFGFAATLLVDVGVAGIHRLLAHVDDLQAADAVIVVAGMEGALASVVGGLTPAPVVAVPTSTGYGSSLAGVTALLGMLATCAAGLAVVGIDNGFGAAHAVARALPPVPIAEPRHSPALGEPAPPRTPPLHSEAPPAPSAARGFR